ncbi:response regulator transcription factor [Pseudozobellia thermophila]|nr:helix-turn-helix transcriptional regulator [Pseudozobellia thermophila]
MNFLELHPSLGPNSVFEDAVVSKMAKIKEACERSYGLMIGICGEEQGNFSYCNKKLRDSIGENGFELLADGWNFWFSMIDPGEVLAVKAQVHNIFMNPDTKIPLVLSYHITNCNGDRMYLRHEICFHQVDGRRIAINYWHDVTEKERIERHLKRSGPGDGAPASNQGPLNISSREEEVLRLIANGFSSKEIADILFISNHTAISHRKNLIEKFQVRNTAHLVKKAADFICLEPFL